MPNNKQNTEPPCHPEQADTEPAPPCYPEQRREASKSKDLNADMASFPIAERFVSINGEGSHAGRLAAFIRFTGCNLACSYCDTSWANAGECPHADCSVAQLVEWVTGTPAACVTLTGGEPALQPGLPALVDALVTSDTWGGSFARVVEIETNGAVDLSELDALRTRLANHLPNAHTSVCFTMDCKMPSSGMVAHMVESNYDLLQQSDAVKFVVGSREDLQEAARVIETRNLCERCTVFLSPVFSCIEPAEIVTFMEARRLSQVRLQLQLHKIIWPDTSRGV